jgi:hypothetical protein
VAAFTLLLQALFATLLAVQMTANAMQWLQFGASICTATEDGAAPASDHHPSHQLPTHNHVQCLVCQAHALPLGLLAVALCVLVTLFSQISIRSPAATGPPWRGERYHAYHSRAPPVTA